jgi:23S rRNA (adenine2503-C2)-methyltransferase
MPINLKNLTAEQLHAAMADAGVTLHIARQIHAAAVLRGEFYGRNQGIANRILDEVERRAAIPQLKRLEKIVSAEDGFTKYLFQGDGPRPFEAVRIPLLHRPGDEKYVVCVSSQVGCAMGCEFCATARLGFERNLAAWEIVDQVIQIKADSEFPVRGVVFMGMGEPMLNYDNVIQAARILSASYGMAIGGKAITISTSGVVPGIRRFTAEKHIYRLIISLNSADPAVRRELMPVEKAYPMSELMAAMREYHEVTRQRVLLAWTMMAGVNTRDEDAVKLAELTKGLPVKLDLIDVNDPTGRFRPPTQAELDAFRDALSEHLRQPVARRYSGGRDIHAACGMLAARVSSSGL